MGRRVFIGQDYSGDYNPSVIGADSDGDDAVLNQLYEAGGGEHVAGDDVEIVGADEEIVGVDQEIVGADVRARPQQANKLVYDQWLPLTGVAGISVGAGASVELELKPQRLFRPGRLTLDAASLPLQLTACSIGQENQFVAGGAVPGEFFARDSIGKQLTSQTAGPGTTMLMTFHNPTAGAIVLRGAWEGKSVVR